jgi:hypothetical protein
VSSRDDDAIDALSMLSVGYFEQVRHGEICHQNMAIGKTPTQGFVSGETKVSGRDYWNN